jgi:exosortase/archaeosortase family protein
LGSIEAIWKRNAGLRFCALFAVWLGVMALAFEWLRPYLIHGYMYPLSCAAVRLLEVLGLEAQLGVLHLAAGICELAVDQVVYQVTFECTGIFALFMCLAAVLAFPASLACKTKGVALVVPAFALYSVLRLSVMGLVAHFAPGQIELFHIYVMVLVNIGFVLLLWLYWVREVVAAPGRETP